MAAELAEKEAALNANPFGRFFAQKCALSAFKRAKGDWAKVSVMGLNATVFRVTLEKFFTESRGESWHLKIIT